MDIPLNAEVQCSDGVCGRSAYVVINPINDRVTHLVVEEEWFPRAERMVPVEWVAETTPETIRLNCSKSQLTQQEQFIEVQYVQGEVPAGGYGETEYYAWPYGMPQEVIPLEHERIPIGELAVQRGADVQATDGGVGRVDEFLVDPESEQITHLVMREGHLWGQRDVAIPVSRIDHIEENTVYLRLSKRQVGELPEIPIRRRNTEREE